MTKPQSAAEILARNLAFLERVTTIVRRNTLPTNARR